jgi:thymidylate synthase (FAD)
LISYINSQVKDLGTNMKPIVKLIAITQGAGELEGKSAQEVITYNARVSNPKNQDNFDTSAGLLRYCINHNHWSIFEQADMTVEINTTRGIAAQILRHKSFFFQEFCMAGDTQVYFDMPFALKQNKRQLYKVKLEDLYSRWERGLHHQNVIKKMNVRIFDENTKTLINSHIKEVFKTGLKDIFEIKLENGKTIKCTKEHKVLTKTGFLSLEDAVGLKLINKTAVISNNVFIGCNGIPLHQDYEWLKDAKEKSILNSTGVLGIAEEADVSYHTIRKWLKIHNICFTKKETAKCFPVWNKGVYGYINPPHSEETKEKMRQKARRGEHSNLWRGGTSGERKQIQADITKYRKSLMEDYNFSCGICEKRLDGKTHLHHIIPVSENIELAREYTNLMPVHPECHMKHHSKNGDHKKWREKSVGNTLTVNWSKIKTVKYLGKQMTYDLEIDHTSHNYVADGVIVHNSQRYADVSLLQHNAVAPDLRSQDTKNRQNSIDNIPLYKKLKMQGEIQEHFARGQNLYKRLVDDGIALECARFVLPLATPTRMYMKGSCRSWIHYIGLRTHEATQKEHRDVADAVKCIFICQFPDVAAALHWERTPECPECNYQPSITLE